MEERLKNLGERVDHLENDMQYLINKVDEILELVSLSSKTMLSVKEVSLFTGLGTWHIYRLTSQHKIPFYKPHGKLMYFDKREIEEWMRGHKSEIIESE